MGGDNVVIEPLDVENYGTWSLRMKALLVSFDGVQYLSNGFRYDQRSDAMAYASLMQSRPEQFDKGNTMAPPPGYSPPTEAQRALLFRLIDKKSAFEWQQGVLESYDTKTRRMRLLVAGQLKEFTLAPNALIYQRTGESRQPLRKGVWIGGELLDFRRGENDVAHGGNQVPRASRGFTSHVQMPMRLVTVNPTCCRPSRSTSPSSSGTLASSATPPVE